MSNAFIIKRAIAATALAGMLASCSGGAHSGVLPNATPTNKPVTQANVRTAMVIKIPAHKTSASGRKPAYISAGTKSIGFNYLVVNGTEPPAPQQNANVTPGSPGCTTDAGGNTTCTLSFGASAGDISYWIDAYDGTAGTGNVLGVANATMTVIAGQDNAFNVTLDGVPSSFKLGLDKTSIPAGTPAAIPVTISAYDTDGNLIVNSPQVTDSYGDPLMATISTGDSTEFELMQNGTWMQSYQGSSTTSIVGQPFTGVTLNYNGGIRKSNDITFTAGNMTASATLTVTAPASTASLVYAPWYVWGLWGGWDSSSVEAMPGGANGTANGVTAFSYNGNQGCTNSGTQVESYSELTTDAAGNVAFLATSPCSVNAAYYPTIVDQAPGASSPAWTITQLGFTVTSFGFDSTDAPYLFVDLGNETVGGVTGDHSQIAVLKPGSTGPYAPTMLARTIDYVDNPETLLVAPDGTVYAAHVGDVGGHTNSEAIDVFAPGANGDAATTAAPVRYIGGSNTGLASIKQMTLDSKGNLYVANAGNGTNSSITVYAPGANGNVAPIRTIAGSTTQLDNSSGQAVNGIGIDAFDNVYATVGNGYVVFAAGANGNVAPSRVDSGGSAPSFTGTMAVVK